VRRLHDASYAVTACGFTAPKEKFGFPYYQLDSNQNFATGFESEAFDVVCIVEVIEHLENQRHTFRQIKILLKGGSRFSDNFQCLKIVFAAMFRSDFSVIFDTAA
jgi:2-polyprenyl-3-methyl-5-hydroxy-6-metoxy-1,4-benzoquinol methylase